MCIRDSGRVGSPRRHVLLVMSPWLRGGRERSTLRLARRGEATALYSGGEDQVHGHLVPTIPRAKLGGPEHEEVRECRESAAPE